MWDEEGVTALSNLPGVARVVALGSVLAVELKPHDAGDGGGYDSTATARIVRRLADAGVYARPLGNVLYVVVTPMTPRSTALWLQGVLHEALAAGGAA